MSLIPDWVIARLADQPLLLAAYVLCSPDEHGVTDCEPPEAHLRGLIDAQVIFPCECGFISWPALWREDTNSPMIVGHECSVLPLRYPLRPGGGGDMVPTGPWRSEVEDLLDAAAVLWVGHYNPDLDYYPDGLGGDTANPYFVYVAEKAIGAAIRATFPTQPPPNTRGSQTKEPIHPALRWFVWERDDFTCQAPGCGARRDLSVDHILAESKGGTLDPDNLQTLCRPCNSRKGNR